MIRHILRKDWALLWKFAIVFPLFTGIAVVTGLKSLQPDMVDAVALPFFLLAFYLIVAVVQHDPIPGTTADWLARPIRRRDLLLAKLLFVCLVIILPILAINTIVGFWLGLEPWRIFKSSFSLGFSNLGGLVLPTMAIAAVTRSFAQSLIGALVATLPFTLFLPLLPINVGNHRSGIPWLADLGWFLVVLASASAILILQYFRRRSGWSRVLGVAACLFLTGLAWVPWHRAWPLLARDSALDSLRIDYDPKAPAFPLGKVAMRGRIYLPVVIESDRQVGSWTWRRAVLTLRYADGTIAEAEAMPETSLVHGLNYLPFEFGNNPLLAEHADGSTPAAVMTVWLQSTKTDSPLALPLSATGARFPTAGWCQTLFVAKRQAIFECLQAGDPGASMTVSFHGAVLGSNGDTLNSMAPFLPRFGPSMFTRKTFLVNDNRLETRESIDPQRDSFQLRIERLQGVVERKVTIPDFTLKRWTDY